MLLEIAISTNKKNIDFLIDRIKDQIFNPNILFTIIWQKEYKNESEEWINDNIRIIKFNEHGLSKSRNKAIRNARGDILLFSDDDIHYEPNIYNTITIAYKTIPDAEIITFKAYTKGKKPFKNYPNQVHKHNIRTAMKVSSWEITCNVSKIRNSNLEFNELFGLGSIFPSAEENLFIIDALKNGLKVYFYPEFIVVHPEEETSSHNFSQKVIESKGAFLYEVFNKSSYFISFFFTLKKYKKSNYSLFKFYKTMIRGIKSYKEIKNG